MNVQSVKRINEGGYPLLQLIIDGKEARLGLDNKRTLLDRYNAVFLGPAFVQDTYVDIPAEPALGQPAARLDGFTDDPQIIALFRDFLADPQGRG